MGAGLLICNSAAALAVKETADENQRNILGRELVENVLCREGAVEIAAELCLRNTPAEFYIINNG